jgi:lipopolysaccharide/colanic/teichoic acid biosynthesis glycosyltransferase
MPTNYQAQVKMTPKTQASRAPKDVVAVASSLKNESVVMQTSPLSVRAPHQPAANRTPDSAQQLNGPAVIAGHTDGVAYLCAKRAIDLLFGSILLVLAIPLVMAAAIVIRLDTPGSPFFFQTRIGKNGKPFTIFKLRGMFKDARDRFPTYYDYSGKRDLEFCFHHEDDPRVTRAGRFIRRTSIDELPNLWNVVKGDVSLVGPRPEIPDVLALYGAYRDEYLSVKPGITCLSKVTGRDRLTKRETIEFDLKYIRQRSFSLDLRILWRTFSGVVLRRDVF